MIPTASSPYPLLFKPVYRDYLWGGNRIASQFSRENTPTPCAESWEISAHPDGMSIVENGPLAGKSLEELGKEQGEALFGSHSENGHFPLLIKIIDAKSRLSVQVHPDEEAAAQYGGEAKTEMWYILDAPADGFVCAGLKPGVGPRIFHDAIIDKKVPSLLRTLKVVPGKSVFIPGGLVHAICEGCLILEVQQNSNTTYRVFDWDRIGTDGKPRLLHLRQAAEVIDWHAPELDLQTPIPMKATAASNKREKILRCDFFTLEKYVLAEAEPFLPDGSSFRVVFVSEGSINIRWAGGETSVPHGRSCLIPASMPPYTIIPADDTATIITVEA